MSFVVGQRRGLRLPGRFSLLAWAVSMVMCTLCMESYLLDIDPATTPKWLVAWLNWSKFLPSYTFPLLFLSILNLFGIWRMTLVSRGLDATVDRIVRKEGGRTVARILYVLGSIWSFGVGVQLLDQHMGSVAWLEPIVWWLELVGKCPLLDLTFGAPHERIAPVSLLPMALNMVIVGAWLGNCSDEWSALSRISGWLIGQLAAMGLLFSLAVQQFDAMEERGQFLWFTLSIVCNSYLMLYGLCAGLGQDVRATDDYHHEEDEEDLNKY